MAVIQEWSDHTPEVVTGQNVEVAQLPESISVKAGETITLKCTVAGGNLPGGVRWYKGTDRNQPVYSDKQGTSNQGVRVIPGSNTDFSIKIQNVRPEDAGTYYCGKVKAGLQESVLALGNGTLVSVIAMPSQPVIIGPTGRITAGSRASFSCSTGGFFPQEITVSWLKDGKKIPAEILNSNEKQSISYRAESTVNIQLEQGDMKSQLICQIEHTSLDGQGPLQETFTLGDVLRVPPKVRLETSPPSPVPLNTTVTVTCNAESFYPDGETLELFAKDAPTRRGTVGPKSSNPDGTFSLKSSLEMMASEERNSSVFLCQVQHDSQPLVNTIITLFITQQDEMKGVGGRPNSNPEAVTITAGKTLILICILTQGYVPSSVEWYKDLGNDQKIIYRESDKFSRWERFVPGSPTDFSVRLKNIGPKDSGTYCCSMVKEIPQGRKDIRAKTVVSVIGR
ncbi:PREDICTED: signal-regulatory protein beta-1 isoform 3-like [Thamnophis sirtalis]|uniref:Signal-regulatory protein beta-1 isoform 3-like n=1 Tax=Thamnophis sirtalis TaxID=35019 RepID=A0A6I9YUH1_9SAUR|nr:PREDICTED: signal-regulatory protein beta-1 isoform 3-like [Thamnophis sirtalis]